MYVYIYIVYVHMYAQTDTHIDGFMEATTDG